MIHIAIVDDEAIVLKNTQNLIQNISDIQDKISVDCFMGAEEFLSMNKDECEYDVVFSDIQMENMNGIEFGMILREKYPEVYLIFLTSYAEYAVESYALEAYQYILKQKMEERLPEVLRKVVKLIENERKDFRIVKVGNDIHKIFYHEIIYIRKIKGSKYVEFVTIKGVYRERIALDQLIKELTSKDFILVERAYVVNIRHIVCLKNNSVLLKNGDKIIVSRSRISDVKEEIHTHWEKKHE